MKKQTNLYMDTCMLYMHFFLRGESRVNSQLSSCSNDMAIGLELFSEVLRLEEAFDVVGSMLLG